MKKTECKYYRWGLCSYCTPTEYTACTGPCEEFEWRESEVIREPTPEAIEKTVHALGLALDWYDYREHPDVAFERIGEQFRRDTGMLRPGKDDVLHSHETRYAEWNKWVEKKQRELVDAIRAALAAWEVTEGESG